MVPPRPRSTRSEMVAIAPGSVSASIQMFPMRTRVFPDSGIGTRDLWRRSMRREQRQDVRLELAAAERPREEGGDTHLLGSRAVLRHAARADGEHGDVLQRIVRAQALAQLVSAEL